MSRVICWIINHHWVYSTNARQCSRCEKKQVYEEGLWQTQQ